VEQWETFAPGKPRAPRFALVLPLRYRRQGGDTWEEGSMRNISRSGLLFTSQQLHPLSTRIELTFALPKVIPDEPPGTVRCEGDIVRSALSATDSHPAAIAIRIVDYEFVRTPAPPQFTGAETGKR
jgi:PilZ domain-containing protein